MSAYLENHNRRTFLLPGSVTLVAVVFHIMRFIFAGPLWRDESAAVQMATAGSFGEIFQRFPHEAFPPPYFLFLRFWATVFGASDLSLRILGLLVGFSILGAVWWVSWVIKKSSPTIGLALIGFNGAFLMWGDEVRGYGAGVLFIIVTIGAIWRMVEQPTFNRSLVGIVGAVCATQVLLHNFVLVCAICCAAGVVAFRKRRGKTILAVAVVWLTAFLSLLPYIAPLRSARDWDIVVRTEDVGKNVFSRLMEAMGASGVWNVVLWLGLFMAVLLLAVIALSESRKFRELLSSRDLLLYCGITGLGSVILYLGFLSTLKYPTQPWYYLALLSVIAISVDVAFAGVQLGDSGRLFGIILTIIIAGGSLPLTWSAARKRMTNVDFLADRLNQVTFAGDVVVVMPWQLGISFNRYYHGAAEWVTIPPVPFHLYHRYDLVKAQMTEQDQEQPIRSALDKIKGAFDTGHNVFVVSLVPVAQPVAEVPTIVPAPAGKYGWNEQTHTGAWCIKTLAYIQGQTLQSKVLISNQTNHINRYEDLALTSFSAH